MPTMCDKSNISYCKTHAAERVIVAKSGDVVLPDYYPDAAEVLSAYADFYVRETELDGRKLRVRGSVRCSVIYQVENGKALHSVTDISDYEKLIDLPDTYNDPYILAKAETAYVSGRVNNSRKLSYSAEGLLEITVQTNLTAALASQGDKLETIGDKRMVTTLAGFGRKQIRIEEDIEIPSSKPQLATLLSCRQTPKLLEQKTVTGKIITKGAVQLQMVYSTPDGTLETIDNEIPFNQILDMDDADEDCAVASDLSPVSLKTEIYENDSGENRILAFEAEVALSAAAYRNVEVSFCRDAYLVGYECEVQRQPFHFLEAGTETKAERSIRETIRFEEKIARVLTFGGMLSFIRPEAAEGGVKMTGNLFVSMIAELQDGRQKCLEAPIPVAMDMMEGKVILSSSAQLENVGYTLIGDDSIEVRAAVRMNLMTAVSAGTEAVTDVVAPDPATPLPKNDYIVLYYPDDNESFWDIGKKFRIGEKTIRMANGFENEDFPRRMLLIPRK